MFVIRGIKPFKHNLLQKHYIALTQLGSAEGKERNKTGIEDKTGEEQVWVKVCLINLTQVQRSLQNANETISLIRAVERTTEREAS